MSALQQATPVPAPQLPDPPLPPDLPPPPLPPDAPAVPGAALPGPGGSPGFIVGVPTNAQELAALRARRGELSDQLNSATSRRNELARRLRNAQGADRVGVEQRMQLLDRRILQLESDIAITGQMLTAAPANAWTSRGTPFDPFRGQRAERGIAAVGSLFTLLVFAPLAFAWARLLWRRGTNGGGTPDRESAQRLARLETAVDAIAVEVERVAEGQRFLTRILAESNDAALGAFPEPERDTAPVIAAPSDPSRARY